jgi:hypothetical protein
VKIPVIVPMVENERLVNAVAFATTKSPTITEGPSLLIQPATVNPAMTEPVVVEQLVYCAPSAGVFIVALLEFI